MYNQKEFPMRYLYLIVFWVLAVYPSFGQGKANLSSAEIAEIRGAARKLVETHLNDLLNTIASDGMGEISRRVVLVNSFLPSESQIFDGPGVIIEDDTNPEYTIKKSGFPDLKVQTYLENLNTFYTKSENYSIKITGVYVSEVMQGPNFPYVLVHYNSYFTNTRRNQTNTKYAPVNRTAELKAEKIGNQWKVLITGIRYFREATAATAVVNAPVKKAEAPPANQPVQTSPPPTSQNTQKEPVKSPATKTQTPVEKTEPVVPETKNQEKLSPPGNPPADKKEVVSKPAEKSPELVPKKSTEAMNALEIKAQKYQKQSLMYKGGAGLAVVGAVATYFVLNSSYSGYKTAIKKNNTSLETWWNANDVNGRPNGQNFGSIDNYKAQPKSLIAYATPGIYIAGAAIVGGAALWIVGSSSSKKAKDLKKQLSTGKLSISPHAAWSQRYAGLSIRYQF